MYRTQRCFLASGCSTYRKYALRAPRVENPTGHGASPPSRRNPVRNAGKARRVLKALLSIGWTVKRQSGSHRVLERDGWSDYVFSFHDKEEIGPRMLARISKHTGLTPKDL